MPSLKDIKSRIGSMFMNWFNFGISVRSESVCYVNKTYKNDIEFTDGLYRSFTKHYRGTSNFYIVCPPDDVTLFSTRFPNVKIVNELDLLSKAGYDYNLFCSMPGHEQQQVIKLIFYLYDSTIKYYITLDSDMLIVKNFDNKVFFHNGKIKTVYRAGSHSLYGNIVNNHLGITNDNRYFINAYGMINVEVLKLFKNFLQERGILNFIEMIKLAPVEYEWYGKYIYFFQHQHFFPMKSRLVRGIQGFVDTSDYTKHVPESDIYNRYKRLSNRRNVIMTYLQYHTCHRGKTLTQIIKDNG